MACLTYGKMRNTHKILIGKFEGKTKIGTPRFELDDNIKMDVP
jgi:hypothetical protein